MPIRTLRCLVMLLLVITPMSIARGQGFIVDRRPNVPIARAFEVREVNIDARIRDQVAQVQISQTFHNPGSTVLESEFLFPVPDDGAIQNVVLLVDGKELTGELMDKDKARRIYEEIVRSKRDPALLEYMGRGLIKTSVFPIPPGADRKVTMRYTQVLKRDRDVVEFSYPFGTQKFTAKPIKRLELALQIDSKEPIKSIYSPSHDIESKVESDDHARIKYVAYDTIPTADFRAVYTLKEGTLGASVLSYRAEGSEDGYFLLLASPDVKKTDTKPQAKTVVFVLDRSGSMSGKKIEQARESLQFVLDNLRDDDTFNIVVYDDRVETFKPELQRFNSETRTEAKRYVENIRPGGSTDIDSALKTALDMLGDDSRPQYVLFLTDGLPTSGVTNEMQIAENARKANQQNARIFSFGVGFDVNARLLDRISDQNRGASEYVKPNEDIEASVARFYSKLTAPVLSGIEITMAGTDLNRTYPRDLPDLFEGGQLVWVGRYTKSGERTIKVKGKVGDDQQTFEFQADLAKPGEGSRYEFIETLWAVRRVGAIIDQIDLQGENKELTEELVALSTKYGILTPYTSFLANEESNLHDLASNRTQTEWNLRRLGEVGGASGVGQRENKVFYGRLEQARPASAPAPILVEPSSRNLAGGMMGGMGGGMGGRVDSLQSPGQAQQLALRAIPMSPQQQQGQPGQSAGAQQAGVTHFESLAAVPVLAPTAARARDFEGHEVVVSTVRNVGKKTFYQREGRWIDAEVKPEEDKKAIVIEQFSEDFFKLAREQGAELNQYLTFAEPVTVKLAGKVYRFDPVKE